MEGELVAEIVVEEEGAATVRAGQAEGAGKVAVDWGGHQAEVEAVSR